MITMLRGMRNCAPAASRPAGPAWFGSSRRGLAGSRARRAVGPMCSRCGRGAPRLGGVLPSRSTQPLDLLEGDAARLAQRALAHPGGLADFSKALSNDTVNLIRLLGTHGPSLTRHLA